MDGAPEPLDTPRIDQPLCARVEIEQPGSWLEIGMPDAVQWTRLTLPIPGLHPELHGLRLVHLSDLHLRDRWAPAYDRLIERLAERPPNLILFTGDFIEDKHDHRIALPVLSRLLPALRSRLGTYAVLGNHDGDLLGLHLPQLGAHDIGGQRCLLGRIELIGFPGVDRSDLDPDFLRQLPPKAPGQLRIALCHYPDLFHTVAACRPDLYLCGHSHGGQICLPGGIPLVTHDRSPRRFIRGCHRRDDAWFIANRGFGAGKLPVRLFCPAEAIEITLVPG